MLTSRRFPPYLRAERAARHELTTRLKVALWRQREPKLSLREAARRLNESEHFTFTGKRWTKGRLAQVVRPRINKRHWPDAASIADALCRLSQRKEAA